MFKKFSSKFKKRPPPFKAEQSNSQDGATEQNGRSPEDISDDGSNVELVGGQGNVKVNVTTIPKKNPGRVEDGRQLTQAASKADVDTIRDLIKNQKIDVNTQDETGQTALHVACASGHSQVVRVLLLYGADTEIPNNNGRNALYIAMENAKTGTVGVLLDFMHSVDTRPRDPFVMSRSRKPGEAKSFVMEHVSRCSQIDSFKERGVDLVHMLVAHGQKATDMAVFLYSALDVQVQHAFFQNIHGDFNAKNFQRFKNKSLSQSVTVLNSAMRVFDSSGYTGLRSLILVSAYLQKLSLDGLNSLELLDIRFNDIDHLPETIKDCKNLKILRISYNQIRHLPREIGELNKNLTTIEASFNGLRRLTSHLSRCQGLRSLQVHNNDLMDLPTDLGLLTNLEELDIHSNKISSLPLSISSLTKLKRIRFRNNPLVNIPGDFPERVSEVQAYMKSLQADPVPNKVVKLVLVGQEGVGKTTLLKAIKRTMWMLPKAPNTPKTEGIAVKDIEVDDITFRCFDCGGDVDFNETHTFFITQGALYLTCFNLSEYTQATVERNSFLLGRLQLWLQYIFSKVPNARVVIVGTHADSDSLKIPEFQAIWEQLRKLLVSAREHHQQYFSRKDKRGDCLLCQSDSKCLRRSTKNGQAGYVNLGMEEIDSMEDETSFNEGPARIVSLPHVVGYYEVSSAKAMGNESIFQVNSNQSIEQLKDAIVEIGRRLTQQNPSIPRRWSNVLRSLQTHIELDPDQSVTTLQEVSRIAASEGVKEELELKNMLHFLKAQGYLLFFPSSDELKDLVVLDPEWLARIFSAVVSYKDTGISNEGFLARNSLKNAYKDVSSDMQDRILDLLHYFGVCMPVKDSQGTDLELFPSKLPVGEPDDSVWPASPESGEKQLTYSVTFPSIIPPPLFSDLMVAIFRIRDTSQSINSCYFSNKLLDFIPVKRTGCRDCSNLPSEKSHDQEKLHRVLFELIPHRRSIVVTARGKHPCCLMKEVNSLLNKVVSKYDGLGTMELDTILCPGCYLQDADSQHRFSAKLLLTETSSPERIKCSNMHILPSASHVLLGTVPDSCLSLATIKPKMEREKKDYSSCPRLFIMLPVNQDGIAFDKDNRLFASSLLLDGYAVHLLCEFPDGYHILRSHGFRLRKPREFLHVYGQHVIAMLRLLIHLVNTSVISHEYSKQNKSMTGKIESMITDYKTKFPSGLKQDLTDGMTAAQLTAFLQEQGKSINRDTLRELLHVVDRPDSFGGLRRLRYSDQTMWLCNEHYRQMRVLATGVGGVNLHHDTPQKAGTSA